MRTLNIFISGTQIDLQPERDAVEQTIRRFPHFNVIRAETRSASDRTPRAEVVKMVEECDIYVGVYGYRYGYIPEGDSISVTEFEFEEARRRRKPILAYVKAKTDTDKREPKQQEFIQRVFDFNTGKFRRPEFTSPDELAKWVEEDVWAEIVRIVRERGGFMPPFYNVPRRLDVFVGRDTYIETLTRELQAGATALVHGFYGVGGLGKTALAIELAYRLRDYFDGGVLWADLPTTNPHNTLADWAREYGGDLSRIEDTNARADALRAILRGKRVLAILDGAVDEADDAKIAPLLRALTDCAVIVTSRVTQLDSLANARRIDLDKMNDDEAVALFEKIVGATLPRDKILAIARAVDYLPLALDLAAAQLREHKKSWTVDDLLTLLRDERARLDTLQWGDGRTRGIRAMVQVSYQRLTADEQKLVVVK